MALPVQSYVWPRLRHVIALWVARTTALPSTSILWDTQNQPSPGLPYVGLTRRLFQLDGHDSEVVAEFTVGVTFTCTATGVGDSVSIVLFRTRYTYTLVLGDTAATARDALLALIVPDLIHTVTAGSNQFGVGFQPCTAVASGVASIAFAGLGFGPVHLHVVEGGTLGAPMLAYRAAAKGLRRALVRVELFWPQQYTAFESADAYADALRDSLLEEETAEWLRQRGVGVEQAARLQIQDASAVSGALRETRLFFDVLFNAQSKRYRAGTSTIDGVVVPDVEALPPTEV